MSGGQISILYDMVMRIRVGQSKPLPNILTRLRSLDPPRGLEAPQNVICVEMRVVECASHDDGHKFDSSVHCIWLCLQVHWHGLG